MELATQSRRGTEQALLDSCMIHATKLVAEACDPVDTTTPPTELPTPRSFIRHVAQYALFLSLCPRKQQTFTNIVGEKTVGKNCRTLIRSDF